jgi:hypothetical protein
MAVEVLPDGSNRDRSVRLRGGEIVLGGRLDNLNFLGRKWGRWDNSSCPGLGE